MTGRRVRGCMGWLAAACLLAQVLTVSANTFTNAGNWSVAGNWSAGTVPVDGEDVVINANVTLSSSSANLSSYVLNAGKIHTFQGVNTALIATNVTINGTVTHDANADAAAPWVADNRVWIQCNNLFVGAAGLINADVKGYAKACGPGKGAGSNFNGGGGYGGVGGAGDHGGAGLSYGSDSAPVDPGSGGDGSSGGAGGGLIAIEAANQVVVNGTIKATGGDGANSGGPSAGSGGSIYIQCLTFTGTNGIISANGGGNAYGTGGGGRIALHYDLTAQQAVNAAGKPTVSFSANAPRMMYWNSDWEDALQRARPGTLWLSDASFYPNEVLKGGELVISGFTSATLPNLTISDGLAVFPAGFQLTVLTNLTISSGIEAGLEITNGAVTVGGNLSVNGGKSKIVGGLTFGNTNVTVAGFLKLGVTNNPMVWAGQVQVTGNGNLQITTGQTVQVGSLQINSASGKTNIFKVSLIDVAGNLSVIQGALDCRSWPSPAARLSVGGDMVVTNTGVLTITAGSSNNVDGYGYRVDVTGTVTVANSAWICPVSYAPDGGSPYFHMKYLTLSSATCGFDANSRGFPGGQGPGVGLHGSGGYYGGGGYGGTGGIGNATAGSGGRTYGSLNTPTNCGSGGGGVVAGVGGGGGLIWLNVDKTATLNGVLRAAGGAGDGGGGRGAGSGGGIYLTCDVLAGSSANLSVKGGDNLGLAGAGGGGRIAIWRVPERQSATTNTWTISTNGGTGGSAPYNGGAGTLYWGQIGVLVEPTITNKLVGGLTSSSATLNGYLLSTGNVPSTVTVFWGTSDAGTNVGAAWQHTNAFAGIRDVGPLSTNVALSPNTLYYYRYYAVNDGGFAWANPVEMFSTSEITIQATDPDASEVALDPGTCTIYRTDVDSARPVTVYYTVSGTASNGLDYDLVSGNVTMGVGVTNATITIKPVADAFTSEGPETVILTITGDAYAIGAMNSATVTIADAEVTPVNTWSGTGSWLDVAHWSSGHKPVDGQYVVVSGNLTITEPSANLLGFEIQNATLTFTNWSTCLLATNVWIGTNTTITVAPAFGDSGMSNRVWIVCTNFFQASGSTINVNQKGYMYNTGPGKGRGEYSGGYYGGAGHGGMGGGANAGGLVGPAYGSADQPIAPGSGGYGLATAGSGGGVVRIDATDLVTVNGVITAVGGPNTESGSGYSSGSGGSIFITCNTFAGTNGTLNVSGGGSSGLAGGGAGGRLAIAYVNDQTVGMSLIANQGRAAWYPGEPGTVWLSNTNFYPKAAMQGGAPVIPGFTSWTLDNLSISNGRVSFPAGFSLNVSGTLTVTGDGGIQMTNSQLNLGSAVFNNTAARPAASYFVGGPDASFDVAGELKLYQSSLFLRGGTRTTPLTATIGGNLTVTNGSLLYMYGSPTNGTESYGLKVDVGGTASFMDSVWVNCFSDSTNGGSPFIHAKNVSIGSGCGFDANQRGYQPNAGPGLGAHAGGGWYGGSGYGGAGAPAYFSPFTSGGPVYGSSNAPVDPGSGGVGGSAPAWGGGVIRIEATDALTLNGTLRANGANGNGGGGQSASSGGSIYLSCNKFYGTSATLTANGGNGTSYEGAGGGGRIAVWKKSDYSNTNGWIITVNGGTGLFTNAFPGTIVWGQLKPAGGTVIVIK